MTPDIVEEIEEEIEEDDLGDDGSRVFGYAKLLKERERQKLVKKTLELWISLLQADLSFRNQPKRTRKQLK